MNTLREALQEYLDLRRSLGFKMHDAGLLLPRFVSFMETRHAEHISTGLAAYSTQREQPFQGKVNRDSTAKRTRIPRHREQTERSDAGPLPFYSDCGFAVNRLRVLRSDSPASVMR